MIKIEGFLFRPKPLQFFLGINGEEYVSSIAKKVDLTFSHAIKVAKSFEKEGLVTIKKEGRVRKPELTPRGKQLQDNLMKTLHDLNNRGEN